MPHPGRQAAYRKGELRRLNHLTHEQNLQLKDRHQNLEAKVVERTQELSKKNMELGDAYISTLKSIVGAIDSQHRSAAGQSERVAYYAGMIARRMGRGRPALQLRARRRDQPAPATDRS